MRWGHSDAAAEIERSREIENIIILLVLVSRAATAISVITVT